MKIAGAAQAELIKVAALGIALGVVVYVGYRVATSPPATRYALSSSESLRSGWA
jgi:hypothetical protein